MLKKYGNLMLFGLGASDLAVTALAWGVAYWMRFYTGWFSYAGPLPPFSRYVPMIVVSLVLTVLVLGHSRMYRERRATSLISEAGEIIVACGVVWVLTSGITYFFQRDVFTRKMLLIFVPVWPTMLIAWRAAARNMLRLARRGGWNLRTAAIVGVGRTAQTLLDVLRHSPWAGIDVKYLVGDNRIGRQVRRAPIVGPIEQIDSLYAADPVDILYIALPAEQHEQTEAVLAQVSTLPAAVRVVPDLLSFHFLTHQVSQLGPLPIVDLTHSPQHGWPGVLKRAFDGGASVLLLVLLAPLMAAIAFGVKLGSRGPVFYRQLRTSIGGQNFHMFKFRSMCNGESEPDGPAWTKPEDPRITRFGRLLRRTSLDELPQLLNVLLGQMSLVGPRPERPEMIERFRRQIPRYMLRHQVKAGMTGWAQVHGLRGQSSLRKRIQYDMYYINNWSFALDLRILAMTVVKGFMSPNAY